MCSKVECMHILVQDVEDQACGIGMEFPSREMSTSAYSLEKKAQIKQERINQYYEAQESHFPACSSAA